MPALRISQDSTLDQVRDLSLHSWISRRGSEAGQADVVTVFSGPSTHRVLLLLSSFRTGLELD